MNSAAFIYAFILILTFLLTDFLCVCLTWDLRIAQWLQNILNNKNNVLIYESLSKENIQKYLKSYPGSLLMGLKLCVSFI